MLGESSGGASHAGELAREIAERARAVLGGVDPGAPESLLAALSEQEREELAELMDRKDVISRFTEHIGVFLELVNGDKRLVAGKTFEERVDDYLQLVAHVRGLWQDAREAFDRGRYATAVFLSIACMEETGKVGVAKLQMYIGEPTGRDAAVADGRRTLYSHTRKHLLVAGQGALINRRLDRLLGLEQVATFLDDVEAGRLEELRQAALYADHDGKNLLLPDLRISQDDALFQVTLAGEVMAEIAGAVPDLWRELLDEVIEFERNQGIALAEDLARA